MMTNHIELIFLPSENAVFSNPLTDKEIIDGVQELNSKDFSRKSEKAHYWEMREEGYRFCYWPDGTRIAYRCSEQRNLTMYEGISCYRAARNNIEQEYIADMKACNRWRSGSVLPYK